MTDEEFDAYHNEEALKEINENVNKEGGLNDKISSYFLEMYIDTNMSREQPEILIKPMYFKLCRLIGNIVYSPYSKRFYFYDKVTQQFSKVHFWMSRYKVN